MIACELLRNNGDPYMIGFSEDGCEVDVMPVKDSVSILSSTTDKLFRYAKQDIYDLSRVGIKVNGYVDCLTVAKHLVNENGADNDRGFIDDSVVDRLIQIFGSCDIEVATRAIVDSDLPEFVIDNIYPNIKLICQMKYDDNGRNQYIKSILSTYRKCDPLERYRKDLRRAPKDIVETHIKIRCIEMFNAIIDMKREIGKQSLKDVYCLELDVMRVYIDMQLRGLDIDNKMIGLIGSAMNDNIVTSRKIIRDKYPSAKLHDNGDIEYTLLKEGIVFTGEKALLQHTDNDIAVAYCQFWDSSRKLNIVREIQALIFNRKIHPVINQCACRTGRISMRSPNIHGISDSSIIASAFAVPEGYRRYSFDAKQQEPRLLAALSKCKPLIDLFNSGGDCYSDLMKRIPIIKDRGMAKRLYLSIMYGAGKDSTASLLNCPVEQADDIKRTFFQIYPEIKHYIDLVTKDARTDGYVTGVHGRKRRLKKDEAYKALNSILQGSCADYMKQAMVDIHTKVSDAKIVIFKHDQLIIDIPGSVSVDLIKGYIEINILGVKIPVEVVQL